jgi:hypothetical protein
MFGDSQQKKAQRRGRRGFAEDAKEFLARFARKEFFLCPLRSLSVLRASLVFVTRKQPAVL